VRMLVAKVLQKHLKKNGIWMLLNNRSFEW
jgi:hypothetical protein